MPHTATHIASQNEGWRHFTQSESRQAAGAEAARVASRERSGEAGRNAAPMVSEAVRKAMVARVPQQVFGTRFGLSVLYRCFAADRASADDFATVHRGAHDRDTARQQTGGRLEPCAGNRHRLRLSGGGIVLGRLGSVFD